MEQTVSLVRGGFGNRASHAHAIGEMNMVDINEMARSA